MQERGRICKGGGNCIKGNCIREGGTSQGILTQSKELQEDGGNCMGKGKLHKRVKLLGVDEAV